MAKSRAPRRKKKADRLLNPGSTTDQIKCDYALAPLDRLATEYELLWGIDRLPELVSVETAARYGAAMAHLNECIASDDPVLVAAAAENCIKGLRFMDAEARANGSEPATGEFWEYRLEADEYAPEFKLAIMRDGMEWQTAKAKRPELEFYTMREVAIALRFYAQNKLVMATKDTFPGAEIVKISNPRKIVKISKPKNQIDWSHGDEIPF